MIRRSMSGTGRRNPAPLRGEGFRSPSRRDYPALRTPCGAVPVTKRSGRSHLVIMRHAAHVRLRNVTYHWTRVATRRDPACRARYATLRGRGHPHGRALKRRGAPIAWPGAFAAAATDAVRSERLRPARADRSVPRLGCTDRGFRICPRRAPRPPGVCGQDPAVPPHVFARATTRHPSAAAPMRPSTSCVRCIASRRGTTPCPAALAILVPTWR